MALISINPSPARSASLDEDFEVSCDREYLAIFDRDDDEYTVLAHCGFAINSPHPSSPALVLINIDATLEAQTVTNAATGGMASKWRVKLKYGPWNPLEHSPDGNPLHRPARFHFDNDSDEVPAFEDVDGNPIVNSAGDPYDPPLMRPVSRTSLIVRRNESPSAVTLVTVLQWGNTVNLGAWNGFPPQTLWLQPPKIPEVEFSQATSTFYYPMEYVFKINWDTWTKQVVNAGLRCLQGGSLTPILIKGQPVSQPVPLDEHGLPIMSPSFEDAGGDVPPDSDPTGEPGDEPGGGEPPKGSTGVSSSSNLVIQAYHLIRAMDFAALNMTNLFTLPGA